MFLAQSFRYGNLVGKNSAVHVAGCLLEEQVVDTTCANIKHCSAECIMMGLPVPSSSQWLFSEFVGSLREFVRSLAMMLCRLSFGLAIKLLENAI